MLRILSKAYCKVLGVWSFSNGRLWMAWRSKNVSVLHRFDVRVGDAVANITCLGDDNILDDPCENTSYLVDSVPPTREHDGEILEPIALDEEPLVDSSP